MFACPPPLPAFLVAVAEPVALGRRKIPCVRWSLWMCERCRLCAVPWRGCRMRCKRSRFLSWTISTARYARYCPIVENPHVRLDIMKHSLVTTAVGIFSICAAQSILLSAPHAYTPLPKLLYVKLWFTFFSFSVRNSSIFSRNRCDFHQPRKLFPAVQPNQITAVGGPEFHPMSRTDSRHLYTHVANKVCNGSSITNYM